MHDIKVYIIKELKNPSAAVDVITNIISCYGKLKELPMLGIALSCKIDVLTDYRYLICGNYIVFYKKGKVYESIYRILYSKRDYVKILLEDAKSGFNKEED